MRTNFHTHTEYCKHAKGSASDYLTQAIASHLTVIGFSDHGPYPDDRFGLRMDYSQLQPHLSELNLIKTEQNNKNIIQVKLGLEIEYDPRETPYYTWLLDSGRCDYLLLGQHFYIDKHSNAINVYSLTSTIQYIEYAHSVVAAMKSGFFKAIAHPDIIFVNDLPWDYNCEMASSIIIEGALHYGVHLELNANGLRRGLKEFTDGIRYQYPHPNFWKLASTHQVPTIINSDCHSPEQVWDTFMDMAHDLSKEWKLNIVSTIF